jgi:beta-lactam-binding protein with PASTA domain
VISQQPEPGSRRESGTPVDLCVSTGPCPVTVPEVVGLDPAAAASALLGGELTVGDVTEACSDAVDAGRVAVQTPAAGTSAAPGTAVHLTVSTGPCPVPLPSVVGLDPVTAQGVILRAGLAVGDIAEVCGSPVAAGHVNSQTPARGTLVAPGSAVALTVSTGPCPVSVPMVVGLDRVAAAGTVLAAGLIVGDVVEVCDDTVVAGGVIAQTPAPGTSVLPGAPVQLTVSTGPCPVDVPEVVGLDCAAAAGAVLAAGLIVGEVVEVCDDTVGVGQVIVQTPVPGTSTAPGTAVRLTVSAGPCPVNVPAVAGLARPTAEGMLLGAGLAVGSVVEVCDDTAAAGRVTVQTPASGASVAPGTAVHLTVSTGPCPVNVPDVTGWARAAAVRGLATAGLVAGGVTEQFSSTVPAGTVMGTTPPAGTLVPRGASVRLEVSKGPLPVESEGEPVRPVPVPEVTGMTRAAAELRLVSSGFALGSVTEVFHDAAPIGEVLGQDPPAGAPAVWGSPMSLIVSKGPEAVGCRGCQKFTGVTGRRLGDLFLGALALVSLAVMGRRPV